MERLTFICALLCALLAVTVSGKAPEKTQIAIDAPTPSDAVAGVGSKVPPGAHGRAKRAATCGTQTTLTPAQAQESQYAHNLFRSKETATNMLSMVWNDELAAVAQAWANSCTWEHGMLYDCSGNRIGQNLFVEASSAGVYPPMNITGTIAAWSGEKKDYTFATAQCTAGKMCGHYTQVVAARSLEVGCGAKQCPKIVVSGQTWTNAICVVCDYRRPGNVVGESLFTAGTPCINCDSDGTGAGYKCVNKLCTKCTPSTDSTCKCGTPVTCQNGGSWTNSVCSCTCPKGFYGNECQYTCTCTDISPEDCVGWAEYCTDVDYEEYMRENCKTTCNIPCTLPPSCSA